MDGQDLTKGSITKELWSLAWPLMLSVFFYTLYNIVDAFWVSKISAEAIAAVSISQIVLFIMLSLGMGITVGSGVLIGMEIGAKNRSEAERILGQSFVLAVFVGGLFTTLALVFRNELLALSGATGLIFDPAMDYFVITAGGSVLLFVLMTIMFAFNFQGDTLTLTKLFALSTLVNVLLDPVLIFGWIGFPALGISGAAIATLVSQALFIIIALRSLNSPKRSIRFHFRNLTLRWASVREVLRIGVPASLTQVINPVGLAALMLITSMVFLEAGAVAFSIGFRVEFFAFLPAVGFGFGAMALISQNIGAGKMKRARESFSKGLVYSFLGATCIGVLAIVFAPLIIGVFTQDAIVTQYTLSYLWIVALSYGLLAASMVEASAFQAIGRSWPGFWIFFLKFVVISIPLAYLSARVLGYPIQAIWTAILAGNIISSIAGYFWIRRAMDRVDPEEAPIHMIHEERERFIG